VCRDPKQDQRLQCVSTKITCKRNILWEQISNSSEKRQTETPRRSGETTVPWGGLGESASLATANRGAKHRPTAQQRCRSLEPEGLLRQNSIPRKFPPAIIVATVTLADSPPPCNFPPDGIAMWGSAHNSRRPWMSFLTTGSTTSTTPFCRRSRTMRSSSRRRRNRPNRR